MQCIPVMAEAEFSLSLLLLLQCHMIHSNMLVWSSRNIFYYYQCWNWLNIFVDVSYFIYL